MEEQFESFGEGPAGQTYSSGHNIDQHAVSNPHSTMPVGIAPIIHGQMGHPPPTITGPFITEDSAATALLAWVAEHMFCIRRRSLRDQRCTSIVSYECKFISPLEGRCPWRARMIVPHGRESLSRRNLNPHRIIDADARVTIEHDPLDRHTHPLDEEFLAVSGRRRRAPAVIAHAQRVHVASAMRSASAPLVDALTPPDSPDPGATIGQMSGAALRALRSRVRRDEGDREALSRSALEVFCERYKDDVEVATRTSELFEMCARLPRERALEVLLVAAPAANVFVALTGALAQNQRVDGMRQFGPPGDSRVGDGGHGGTHDEAMQDEGGDDDGGGANDDDVADDPCGGAGEGEGASDTTAVADALRGAAHIAGTAAVPTAADGGDACATTTDGDGGCPPSGAMTEDAAVTLAVPARARHRGAASGTSDPPSQAHGEGMRASHPAVCAVDTANAGASDGGQPAHSTD